MTDKEEITEWWKNHIDSWRNSESAPYYSVQDYEEPCQVEVFWLEEPMEGQLIFVTHDRDREDKQIIVNGPYSGSNFVEEVSNVKEEDRWQKAVPPQVFKSPPGETPKREDVLASKISTLFGRVEESIFADFSSSGSRFLNESRLWGKSSFHVLTGNVTEMESKDESEATEESEDSSEDDDKNEDSEERETGETKPIGGGFIYPAVWVEQAPERSFSEKVWGTSTRENEIVYRETLLDKEFVAFRDGLLALTIDNENDFEDEERDVGGEEEDLQSAFETIAKEADMSVNRLKDYLNLLESDEDNLNESEKILCILNTFFGIGIIGKRFKWRSLQPIELISGKLGSEGFKSATVDMTDIPAHSGRNDLWRVQSRPKDFERNLVTNELIDYFLDITETIYPQDELRERLLLHLQAHTHFIDEEYKASFLLNWTVVEQFIEDATLEELKDQYKLNSKRRGDIEGSNWSISNVLEVSEIIDVINEDLYFEISKHRKKRNSVVHEGESVKVKAAEDLDHLVSELICREINQYLESTSIEKLNHAPIPMKPQTRIKWRDGDYKPKKWK